MVGRTRTREKQGQGLKARGEHPWEEPADHGRRSQEDPKDSKGLQFLKYLLVSAQYL